MILGKYHIPTLAKNQSVSLKWCHLLPYPSPFLHLVSKKFHNHLVIIHLYCFQSTNADACADKMHFRSVLIDILDVFKMNWSILKYRGPPRSTKFLDFFILYWRKICSQKNLLSCSIKAGNDRMSLVALVCKAVKF